MKKALLVLALSAVVSSCAVQPRKVCPTLRDMGENESLKHYTIHVLNMYNMCRDTSNGKHINMPATDTVQDEELK